MATIKVTAEHIEKGLPRRTYCCPVALALRDAFPDTRVRVCGDGWMDIGNKSRKIPKRVRDFIDAVDSDSEVEPFSFRLHIDG